jgi:hypothetical protein
LTSSGRIKWVFSPERTLVSSTSRRMVRRALDEIGEQIGGAAGALGAHAGAIMGEIVADDLQVMR